MKNTVNHHPVQFPFECLFEFDGILPDGIDTYEQIAGQLVPFAIIESDYVSKIVVAKILLIDVKYVVVRTENDIYIAQTADFTFRDQTKPLIVSYLSLKDVM